MKKINLILFFVLSIQMYFISCQKEEQLSKVKYQSTSVKQSSFDSDKSKQAFNEDLDSLILEVEKIRQEANNNLGKSLTIDPNSSNNYLDEYGVVLAQSLGEFYNVNKNPIQIENGKNLISVQQDLFEDIVKDNNSSLPEIPNQDSPDVTYYGKVLIDTYNNLSENISNDDAFILVSKAYEQYILSSNFLTDDDKNYLLVWVSGRKHVRSLHSEKSVYWDGEELAPALPGGGGQTCFDSVFESCMRKKIEQMGPVESYFHVVTGDIFISTFDCVIEAVQECTD